MDTTTLVLAGVALLLLTAAVLRSRDLPLAGISAAGRLLWNNAPIILLGFTIAGLVQVLIPRELVASWLGQEAGIKGILIASAAGGLLPGPPYAVFPLVGGLYRSGVGLGPVVSFLSAWALWSVTRLPVEMALVDPKVSLIRYAITFVVPPFAGILAGLLARLLL